MKTPAYYVLFLWHKLKKKMVLKRTSLANHKKPPFINLAYQHYIDLQYLAGKPSPSYPNCRFIVLSDLHYYNQKELGAEGEEWEDNYAQDRKLFKLGDEIIERLIYLINQSKKIDFVLITGDLTKDGELLSHQQVAVYLAQMNKPVYVLPGNHDLLNPEASSFWGKKRKTPFVNREEFAKIYENFGFKKAFKRDKTSLSYSLLIKKKLMLICLDSVWPNENESLAHELIVDGRLQKGTWRWLEAQLIWAKKNDVAVMVAQHHPLLEHWQGELQFMPDYLIENHLALRSLYIAYGVKVVFVGHFHAQDLTLYQHNQRSLYQVLTASPLSYPCCYRVMEFEKGFLKSKTFFIRNLPSCPSSNQFKQLAKAKLHEAVTLGAEKALKKMGVKKNDRELISHSAYEAVVANYGGFEGNHKTPSNVIPSKETMGLVGRLAIDSMSYVIKGMWGKHNNYSDNNFSIKVGATDSD